MNKTLRVHDYLGHILAAIERIERHTADVGEAANNILRVDAAFADAHGEIPWQACMPCAIGSHGYDKVDLEMVWRTVCNDLPDLYRQIKALSA